MSTGNAYGAGTTTFGGGVPVWIEILGKWQAGGKVANLPAAGGVIAVGSPVEMNSETHVAKILNFYKVHETIDAADIELKISVLPGLPRLIAGVFVMPPPATLAGTGAAVTVGAVTQGDDYDTFAIVANSLGVLTAGDLIVEAAETGAGKALYAIPNSLTANDVHVDTNTDYSTVAGVYSGSIYAKRTPLMTAVVKANMPKIAFDDSY